MKSMRNGAVCGIDKPISRLIQGTELFKSWEPEVAIALLDAVFALGCTAFDTAHSYGDGHCERILGRWLANRGNRNRVVIISKGAHPNADRKRVTPFDIASDLHVSLARMGVDCIDLYLLHRDDPSVPVGPIMEALNEHLQAGRVRAIGASNWTHLRIQEANAYAERNGLVPFVATSPNFSLTEQREPPWEGCLSITGVNMAAARQWYAATQMPVFSWATLSLGFLSGRISRTSVEAGSDSLCLRSFGTEENFRRLDRAAQMGKEKGLTVPQVAIAYVMSQPLNLFPIIASASAEEFKANRDATDLSLTSEEVAWLNLESSRPNAASMTPL